MTRIKEEKAAVAARFTEDSALDYLAFEQLVVGPYRDIIREYMYKGNEEEAFKAFQQEVRNGGFAHGPISAMGNQLELADGRAIKGSMKDLFRRVRRLYQTGYQREDLCCGTPLPEIPSLAGKKPPSFRIFNAGDITSKCLERLLYLKGRNEPIEAQYVELREQARMLDPYERNVSELRDRLSALEQEFHPLFLTNWTSAATSIQNEDDPLLRLARSGDWASLGIALQKQGVPIKEIRDRAMELLRSS
jgi:hypothetical protein